MAAYQPISANSLADSYVNLANPGVYDATQGNQEPSWNTWDGWVFNGVDQSLDTNMPVPEDGWSMIVMYEAENPQENNILIGELTTGARFEIWTNRSGGVEFSYGDGTSANQSPLDSGVLALCGGDTYKNGVPDLIGMGNWTETAAYNIRIARLNRPAGAIQYYYGGSIQALAIYNETLTANQVTAITKAMEELRLERKWWEVGGTTGAIAVYQPLGARSLELANRDLVGNRDLVWQEPMSWDSNSGWKTPSSYGKRGPGMTEGQQFLTDIPITFVWRGNLANETRDIVIGTNYNWDTIRGHTHSTSLFYIGANKSFTDRFGYDDVNGEYTIVYVKRADESQSMFVNGVEVEDSPMSGTATDMSIPWVIATAKGNCKAVAIYDIALSDANAIAVSNAVMAL